jgi:methylenetetrahydrofolate reductase (NADPH)
MQQDVTISFEFFPPKTDLGREKLLQVRRELDVFAPDFYSVTYGAGGSTREHTLGIVQAIQAEGCQVAPHLSFGGDSESAMLQLLSSYRDSGINRLVALRGDMPSGLGGSHQMVYANQLVAFIRQHFADHFQIAVAAYPEIHPESRSFDSDIAYLKGKFDAGANLAITQYFYNPDAYFYFVESCRAQGITQPIVPGIMPITNFKNLSRFSDNCGAEIPRWLRKRLESYGDDLDSIRAFGLDVVTELCDTLLDNDAPGLHFYTMNQTEPCASILHQLGWSA